MAGSRHWELRIAGRSRRQVDDTSSERKDGVASLEAKEFEEIRSNSSIRA